MNYYQALTVHQSDRKEYIITMNVAEFKRLLKTAKGTSESNENAILFNSDSNVDWVEVELDMDDRTYYGQGFLKMEFALSNEVMYFNNDIDKLGDYDTISVNCMKG